MRLLPLCLAACLGACAGPRDAVTLLDASPLAVTTRQGTQTLQAPYATAAVQADGRMQPGTTTAAAVQARYGAVLGTLPAAGRVYTLRFATGQTTLEEGSQAEVPALLAEVAARAPAVEVLIEGHTDQAGTEADNEALSLARAEAVRDLLVTQGLTASFVRVVGMGSRQPVIDAPGQDEPRNRRVEVIVR